MERIELDCDVGYFMVGFAVALTSTEVSFLQDKITNL